MHLIKCLYHMYLPISSLRLSNNRNLKYKQENIMYKNAKMFSKYIYNSVNILQKFSYQ